MEIFILKNRYNLDLSDTTKVKLIRSVNRLSRINPGVLFWTLVLYIYYLSVQIIYNFG